MKKLVFLVLLCIILSACGKDTTVSGRVYDPNTNQGIANIKVIVSKEKINPIPFSWDGAGATTEATTTTDANGNYLLNFHKNKNRTYYLYFLNDDDLFYKIESEMKFLETNEVNQIIDYKLVPSAFIKKKIKNINCFDENDKIEIYASDDFGEIPSNIPYTLIGCVDQTSATFGKTISGKIYYHWIVTKNNLTTHHYDTITLMPNEERYYEILY